MSGVFTWQTTLSSTHNTVIGILAPHLSQSAVIPHLIPIAPVLLESGRITLGFASIILPPKQPSTSSSPPASNGSALNHRLKSAGEGLAERERRKRRPLDAADMEINTTGRRVQMEGIVMEMVLAGESKGELDGSAAAMENGFRDEEWEARRRRGV